MTASETVAKVSLEAARLTWRKKARLWWLAHAGELAEWAIIGLWAAWVGRAFLNSNIFDWPVGREFGSQVLSHHLWVQMQRCGLCALWNGQVNGGYPALADVFGSSLHPVVMVTTLMLGVVNGVKATFIISLGLAGLAQWWIARTLGTGRVARLWSAFLVIVGGHLATRLDVAAFDLVTSTATCSLALAAALHLGVNGRRRAAILLAGIGAMAIVAGQGYMQLGLVGWVPAFLFFLLDEELRLRPVVREYVLALGLAVLIAGVFLVPVAHFWPHLSKFDDVEFKSAQPLAYIPLNLVINDWRFLNSDLLGKLPFPYLYNLFVGWMPVLLAPLTLRVGRREHYPALLCLATGVGLMFFAASAIPLRWLAAIVPEISGFRHPPLLAGLAVPGLLGLAAYGLDGLLKATWPQIVLRSATSGSGGALALSLAWVLALPLISSVRTVYNWGQGFIKTTNVQDVYVAIEAMRTPDLQWVAPPLGEHYWVEPALTAGLKVSNVVWAWGWKGRELPQPRLLSGRDAPPPNVEVVGQIGDLPIYLNPDVTYAYVDMGEAILRCAASGTGGNLTVKCSNDQPGKLIVQDNAWSGWRAWRDKAPTPLFPNRWLSVEAPAGNHIYEFQYRPWDVAVGLVVTLVGLFLAVWLWLRSPATSPIVEAAEVSSQPAPKE